MALPASDSFTYSNGKLSTVSSGAWADASGTFFVQVASNAATFDASAGDCLAYWASDVFGNDQSSQAVITGTAYPGLAVRVTGSGNGYLTYNNSGTLAIEKMVGGARTNLANWTFTSGHTEFFSAVGTTLQVKDNGVSVGTTTDATFGSGSAGLFMYNGGSGTADNWVGDNVGGAATTWGALLGLRNNRLVVTT
jgi:hypothetical protein